MVGMTNLIPFNRKNNRIAPSRLEDFHSVIDDFFSDNWVPGRSLLRDTFKVDIQETNQEYVIEAELPGIIKDEITLNVEDESLCISVNRSEELNQDEKNYIHRERRVVSMSRRIHLAHSKKDEIKAKLEDGILKITVPKQEQVDYSQKIEIE